MVFIIALVVGAVVSGTCWGQEFGGSFDSRLSWVPDEGFLVTTQLYAKLDFGATDTWGRIRIKENVFEKCTLGIQWYERPLRLSGEAEFAEGTLDQGKLEFRYWEAPWNVKLRGTFEREEGRFLEFLGTYEDEAGLKGEWSFVFGEPLSLRELKATLTLPLGEEAELQVAVKMQEGEDPQYTVEWKGMTRWGELWITFLDLTLDSVELYREWTAGQWTHELDITLDVPGIAAELDQKSTFHLTEQMGYGFSSKVKQEATFELTRLNFFLFGPGWKLTLKAVDQEIHVEGEKAVGEDVAAGGELYLYPEEWEGSIWLWGYTEQGVEWEMGCGFSDGGAQKLYLEIYVEI